MLGVSFWYTQFVCLLVKRWKSTSKQICPKQYSSIFLEIINVLSYTVFRIIPIKHILEKKLLTELWGPTNPQGSLIEMYQASKSYHGKPNRNRFATIQPQPSSIPNVLSWLGTGTMDLQSWKHRTVGNLSARFPVSKVWVSTTTLCSEIGRQKRCRQPSLYEGFVQISIYNGLIQS